MDSFLIGILIGLAAAVFFHLAARRTPAAEFRPHVDATRLERALPGPEWDGNGS